MESKYPPGEELPGCGLYAELHNSGDVVPPLVTVAAEGASRDPDRLRPAAVAPAKAAPMARAPFVSGIASVGAETFGIDMILSAPGVLGSTDSGDVTIGVVDVAPTRPPWGRAGEWMGVCSGDLRAPEDTLVFSGWSDIDLVRTGLFLPSSMSKNV